MVVFEKTIGRSEAKYFYLNLTDDGGITYGADFPPDRTRLWIITEGRRYKASKRGLNQIWGVLKDWYRAERTGAGDSIRIQYDPEAQPFEGRIPVTIEILERMEREGAPDELLEFEQEEEQAVEVSLQMERDLEDFIANNLELIEEGLELFVDEEGRDGRQYPTEVGKIDLLCKKGDDLVVVELKKRRTSDMAVGLISRYIGVIKETIAEEQNVRGIIIVHDFDPRLKYAILAHQNIDLKYYEIQIKFISEEEIIAKIDR